MSKAIVTVGPRDAGKSSMCRQIVHEQPDILYISRDEILIELFGSTILSAYDGGHFYAMEVMWERISQALGIEENHIILLDCWNGYPEDRKALVEGLHELGIETIIAWYFITPLHVCLQWFRQNKDSNDYRSEEAFTSDFLLYHSLATDIRRYTQNDESDDWWNNVHSPNSSFDAVIRINPLQLTLPGIKIII